MAIKIKCNCTSLKLQAAGHAKNSGNKYMRCPFSSLQKLSSTATVIIKRTIYGAVNFHKAHELNSKLSHESAITTFQVP